MGRNVRLKLLHIRVRVTTSKALLEQHDKLSRDWNSDGQLDRSGLVQDADLDLSLLVLMHLLQDLNLLAYIREAIVNIFSLGV